MDKDSAIPPGTPRRNTIAVDKDHSNMVKFGEDDPVYRTVVSFVFDLTNDPEIHRESQVGQITSTPVQRNAKTFSTVPFPKDPRFVGREDILEQLESTFANLTSQHRASIYGLGGIG